MSDRVGPRENVGRYWNPFDLRTGEENHVEKRGEKRRAVVMSNNMLHNYNDCNKINRKFQLTYFKN